MITSATTSAAAPPTKNPVHSIVPQVGDEPAMRDWAAELVAKLHGAEPRPAEPHIKPKTVIHPKRAVAATD